jgi:hypothetical protein
MQATFKYPRTMHLPSSPGLQNDDRVLLTFNGLVGNEVVASIKYDGEGTSMYTDGLHARSMDGRSHPSRDWVKMFHGTFAHEIPVGLRICGENMYAQHSIAYDDLESYFYGFSMWEGENVLSWDDTLTWFKLLGITPVKELYRGPFDLAKINELTAKLDPIKDEGLVVRCTKAFTKADFEQQAPMIAKWVRKGHVQTDEHWMLRDVIPNKLRTNHAS